LGRHIYQKLMIIKINIHPLIMAAINKCNYYFNPSTNYYGFIMRNLIKFITK